MRKRKVDCKKPPALHLLDNKSRFHLHSDTSKFAKVTDRYQIQNCKAKGIAYASTLISKITRNYSITELESWGFTIILML